MTDKATLPARENHCAPATELVREARRVVLELRAKRRAIDAIKLGVAKASSASGQTRNAARHCCLRAGTNPGRQGIRYRETGSNMVRIAKLATSSHGASDHAARLVAGYRGRIEPRRLAKHLRIVLTERRRGVGDDSDSPTGAAVLHAQSSKPGCDVLHDRLARECGSSSMSDVR